jgi:electron transfer flavoprotein beta subunit
MRVVVCIKHILDPELPPSRFEIDPELKCARIGNHAFVMSPFDANALEMALQMKDRSADVQVAALTYGDKKAEESLRKALGVLADEAVHVMREEGSVEDPVGTARVLAAAIRNTGPADIVLCGRQAGDTDGGVVGSLIAEELGIPPICFASKLEAEDGYIRIWREAEGAAELVRASLPVLVTATNDESNVLRIAKVRDVMKSHRMPVKVLTLKDLGLEPSLHVQRLSCADVRGLYTPVQDNVCQILEGEEPEEKIETLLLQLRNQKLL